MPQHFVVHVYHTGDYGLSFKQFLIVGLTNIQSCSEHSSQLVHKLILGGFIQKVFMSTQYRKTTVGPLSIKKCPHHLLAANVINIFAASKRQQFTIKLYYRINGFDRARHLGLSGPSVVSLYCDVDMRILTLWVNKNLL
jgi:hypothetical protein